MSAVSTVELASPSLTAGTQLYYDRIPLVQIRELNQDERKRLRLCWSTSAIAFSLAANLIALLWWVAWTRPEFRTAALVFIGFSAIAAFSVYKWRRPYAEALRANEVLVFQHPEFRETMSYDLLGKAHRVELASRGNILLSRNGYRMAWPCTVENGPYELSKRVESLELTADEVAEIERFVEVMRVPKAPVTYRSVLNVLPRVPFFAFLVVLSLLQTPMGGIALNQRRFRKRLVESLEPLLQDRPIILRQQGKNLVLPDGTHWMENGRLASWRVPD